jgi:hypothetical protein
MCMFEISGYKEGKTTHSPPTSFVVVIGSGKDKNRDPGSLINTALDATDLSRFGST